MPIPKIKRNRYYEAPFSFEFTSQNLYQDQIDYYLPIDRVQSASLRDWGIGHGLTVSGAPGDSSVIVAAGAAIDIEGRAVFLADSGTADIGVNPPGAQHDEIPVPAVVPLAGQAGIAVYVTISFSEITRFDEGSGGRTEIVPWIRLQPVTGTGAYVDDGASVVLAIAVINSGGLLTSLAAYDPSLPHRRKLAGKPAGSVRIKRAELSGTDVADQDSGYITGRDSGGLTFSVPQASDVVSITRYGNSIFSRMEMRAENVVMQDSGARDVFDFDSSSSRLNVGATGNGGDFRVTDSSGRQVLNFTSSGSILNVGANGNAGDIRMYDHAGRNSVKITASSGAMYLGANGNEGDLIIYDNNGRDVIKADGKYAYIRVGHEGNEGDLIVNDAEGRDVFYMNGHNALLKVGHSGNEGDIRVADNAGQFVFDFDGKYAVLRVGANGNEGDIIVRDAANAERIHLNGENGRITANGHRVDGNPARRVKARHLFNNGGTTSATVDLGSDRAFFAFVSIVMLDSLTDFDRDNGVAADIFRVDGVIQPSWIWDGDHFGGEGANSNVKRQYLRGTGREIVFRLRNVHTDLSCAAIGVVFYE